MTPNFEEKSYDLADESLSFTERAALIEEALWKAYRLGEQRAEVVKPVQIERTNASV